MQPQLSGLGRASTQETQERQEGTEQDNLEVGSILKETNLLEKEKTAFA